jgi:hypothetical protein
MRALLAFALLSAAAISALETGCTPYIPVKDDFATSALTPVGDVPPEFAEFNNFDPAVNVLMQDQMCATSYEPLEAKTLGASSGKLVDGRGRCRQHIPIYGGGSDDRFGLAPR